MTWRLGVTLSVLSAAFLTAAQAKDISYIGHLDIVLGAEPATQASGTVFEDSNRNSKLDAGEKGVPEVLVSNGREVVKTDGEGRYSLPAYEDMNLFITKPANYTTPLDQDLVPQFNYIHKVEGSPPLRFGGIEPTGPLPQEINFPLIQDPVGDQFQCLVFGDPQPYSNRELGFVRDTAGTLLAGRDNSKTECLIFEGDVMGDDLALYPRFKRIMAVGGVPQYFVPGNHDLDWDAKSDADSFDTFRREWGPEYYSFDIGKVHFVVLDNVRYPCNGVDPHPFCDLSAKPSYNGVISKRQLDWLKNDLAQVPEDRLIVLNAHIPFVSFSDAESQKHQTDNFAALAAIIGDRPALGLAGHTHTTEQSVKGESYAGWHKHTGVDKAPFHLIIVGAVSASWWAGDLNDHGVPHATQRLGTPRGYYIFDFDGTDYRDTYRTFDGGEEEQMAVSFSTPRFRAWAKKLFGYTEIYDVPLDITPPVTINDLGDRDMLTLDDLDVGTWVVINLWNGTRDSKVTVSIDGGEAITAERTQKGEGEHAHKGIEYTDPWALAKQSTNGRIAFKSTENGEETDGFQTWRGFQWSGPPGPFPNGLLTQMSSHIWRAPLPKTLPVGAHRLEVLATDRHGRTFREVLNFEVVEELPPLNWTLGKELD